MKLEEYDINRIELIKDFNEIKNRTFEYFQITAQKYFDKFNTNVWEGSGKLIQLGNIRENYFTKIIIFKTETEWSAEYEIGGRYISFTEKLKESDVEVMLSIAEILNKRLN